MQVIQMTKKLLLDDVKDRLIPTGIELISEYTHRNDINTLFLCYCGKSFTTKPSHIFDGRTTSCGCYHKEQVSKARLINRINKTFEKLTVIKRLSYKIGKEVRYSCRCQCGKIHEVASNNLNSKQVKSCGCLRPGLIKNERGYLYNPNLTDEDRENNRNSLEDRVWIKNVFERDNYTCQICRSKKALNAHHLDAFHWCIERRIDLSNGVCLCEDCHINFHKKYGYINSTEQQFKKYIGELV